MKVQESLFNYLEEEPRSQGEVDKELIGAGPGLLDTKPASRELGNKAWTPAEPPASANLPK